MNNVLKKILFSKQLKWHIDSTRYKKRVFDDSAVTESLRNTDRIYKGLEKIGILDSVKFLWTGEMGTKERVSGVNHYATKLYSGDTASNDAVQTTELNQPFLSGNIAPNERLCLNNPNGGVGYISHPEIAFSATDSWSVTFVINWNGGGDGYPTLSCDNNSGTGTSFTLSWNDNIVSMRNSEGTVYRSNINSIPLIGKISIITLVSDGNGNLKCYLNGVEKAVVSAVTSIILSKELASYYSPLYLFNGKYYGGLIHAQALSQQQVTAEYNLLRSIYPEIESVVIGNSPTEKIINGGFDTNTNSWILGGNWIWNNGKLSATGGGDIRQDFVFTNGAKYRLTFTISDYVSGNLRATMDGGTTWTLLVAANGTYSFELTAGISWNRIVFSCNSFNGSIDNISVIENPQEWATSNCDMVCTPMGNVIPNVTDATAWAALTTPAWCYYNNDPTLGSIYGKLYNWYAVKLIQDDIDAYNTANPTNHWGWHVPSSTEFNTLATTLGGASVAGGKMKVAGSDYWMSANIGGDNSSGYSALGSGVRHSTLGFLPYYHQDWAIDIFRLNIYSDNINCDILIDSDSETWGRTLRLIKD